MIDILQCDPDCGPGNLAPYLNERQHPWRLIRLDLGEALPTVADNVTVLLGGRMGVYDDAAYPFLTPLKAWLQRRGAAPTPLLGICLGGQLLAQVLGGRVTSNACREKGIQPIELTAAGTSDRIFAGMAEQLTFFQWHNDSFEPPSAAISLASSPACPGQAFRYNNAWGLQFHPEVDQNLVSCWCRGEADGAAILSAFQAQADALTRQAFMLYDNFFAGSGIA